MATDKDATLLLFAVDALNRSGRPALADWLQRYARQADENLNRLVAAREAYDRWDKANGNEVALVVAIGMTLGVTEAPRAA